MKTAIITIVGLICLMCGSIWGQEIKDPARDYYEYQFPKSGEHKMYVIEAPFTADGKKIFLITDDGFDLSRDIGRYAGYGWMVYVPSKSGGYKIIDGILDESLSGPSYIGYVGQIKQYGIVSANGKRNVVSVRYVAENKIQITFLGKNGKAGQDVEDGTPEDYPKYFQTKKKPRIIEYTSAQLRAKYK